MSIGYIFCFICKNVLSRKKLTFLVLYSRKVSYIVITLPLLARHVSPCYTERVHLHMWICIKSLTDTGVIFGAHQVKIMTLAK